GKLLDAMQCGTPSITTLIGAEAMHADLPWPGAVVDNPEQFANAAIAMYGHENLWLQAQSCIDPILSGVFSKDVHHALFGKRLRELTARLAEERASNFIGRMLMHHPLRSTEYM